MKERVLREEEVRKGKRKKEKGKEKVLVLEKGLTGEKGKGR